MFITLRRSFGEFMRALVAHFKMNHTLWQLLASQRDSLWRRIGLRSSANLKITPPGFP
jgi:hypothetical protein